MKAVIMAGGEGSRLRPLTCDRPKPMVPVADRPVMEYTLDLLRRHGFTDIYVTLQYLPDAIAEHFGDGSRFGVQMHYFVEEIPLGTAGGVRNIGEDLDETFLVMSGDGLTDIDLSRLLEFHRARKAAVTIALQQVDNPLEYGVVMTGPDGRVNRFLEKPGWGEVFSDTINTGIYVIEPRALAAVPSDRPFDFSKDLFPKLLVSGRSIYGCVCPGYWCDIGDLDQYLQANLALLSGMTGHQPPGEEIAPGVWVEKGATVDPAARLQGPALIGPGCRIAAGASVGPSAILGRGARVEPGATIRRSVLWENVYVGTSCALRGAVLADAVTVHSGAAAYEGAVIGRGTNLGRRSILRPGVKLWPDKRIETASVVDSSLVWGRKLGRALFGSDGIAGLPNVDLTPEVAAKVGAAFGSVVAGARSKESTPKRATPVQSTDASSAANKGPAVLVSSDSNPASQMLKAAIASGIVSAGVDVGDLGSVPITVARNSARTSGAFAVHASSGQNASPGDEPTALIRFFDPAGQKIGRDLERKIESAFAREDFSRAAPDLAGRISPSPGASETYVKELLASVDGEIVREAGLAVCGSWPSSMGEPARGLLQGLGCRLIPGDPTDQSTPPFNLGFRLDALTLDPVLYDEKRRGAGSRTLEAVALEVTLGSREPPEVLSIPVTASRVLEELARRHGRKVRREKISAGEPLDGLRLVAQVLEWMARTGRPLSELIDAIPEIRVLERSVPCPWEAKGRVMRLLAQEQSDRVMEQIDGLKLRHDRGWTLLLPDPGEPCYRIYAEADSWEVAEELAGLYARKVNELARREGATGES